MGGVMEIQKGIVGFIDILGYQNLIDNNELSEIINIIHNITQIGSKVNEEIDKLFGDSIKELNISSDPDVMHIDLAVISDSIIMTKPINENDKGSEVCAYTACLYGMLVLCRSALIGGISVKGAIDYGEYIKKENIFASKALINAYRVTNNLDFSGIVVCSDFIDKFNCTFSSSGSNEAYRKILNAAAVKVVCPTKTGEKEYYVLDWTNGYSGFQESKIKQFLYNSFGMHGKAITNDVVKKIDNTERVIRSVISKNQLALS